MKVLGSVAHYGVGTVMAVLLAALLGSIPLFQNAALGGSHLTAAQLVQFLGYVAALVMLWMMGHRMTIHMPKNGKWIACLRPVIRPLVTLVVVMAAYVVIPMVGGPALEKGGRTVYNWLFIVGMLAASLWLLTAWLLQSGQVIRSLEGRRGR